MINRLVLGCGALDADIFDSLVSKQGELHALDSDPDRVETLRNEKIPAHETDFTTIDGIEGYDPDIIIIGSENQGKNHSAARAARSVYPEAYLIGYLGGDATPHQYNQYSDLVDYMLTPGSLLLDHIDSRLESGIVFRSNQLRETLTSISGTLGIFMHDNPDPDAIASAVALESIANELDIEADPCYFGEISHQENRAFVNLLELDLRNVGIDESIDYDAIALVDHSQPGVNDQLPEDTAIRIVIDHHPTSESLDATFADTREEAGATSTLMTDYLRHFTNAINDTIATALLYGIRVDTKNFSRDISVKDFNATAYLLDFADTSIIERIESPSVSPDTLYTIAEAIQNRNLRGTVVTSCVGEIRDRDALSQAADQLIEMQGVSTSFVYGFDEDTVHISARSHENDVDLGTVLRSAYQDVGNAGGHVDMAGGQIPLGLFGNIEETDASTLRMILEDVIPQRFFSVLDSDVIETTEE
ncbi:MAG: bifunctional oligoribonuclease/PAP phosphatase NrnA [Halobacteriaceae archaeon]